MTWTILSNIVDFYRWFLSLIESVPRSVFNYSFERRIQQRENATISNRSSEVSDNQNVPFDTFLVQQSRFLLTYFKWPYRDEEWRRKEWWTDVLLGLRARSLSLAPRTSKAPIQENSQRHMIVWVLLLRTYYLPLWSLDLSQSRAILWSNRADYSWR